jgi:lysophospholipase L1-like esterase
MNYKSNIMRRISYIYLVVLLAACQRPNYTQTAPVFEPDYELNRFESTIKNYEKQDSLQMPASGGVVLAGSSSFYFWKNAANDLSPLPIINRGFGGSTLPEVSYYVERTILKYKPKTVMIYCENDMYGSKTKTPAQVRDAYVKLTQQIRSKLPKVQLYFVGLKPSPLRWSRWKESFIKTDKKHGYIDVSAAMMAANGRPDSRIFLKDSLHMNLEGYRRWTNIIKPVLEQSK